MSNKKKGTYQINNGDVVFATGVFLTRDTTINGGWLVTGFEDDTFYDGVNVNTDQTDDGETYFYTGDDETY